MGHPAALGPARRSIFGLEVGVGLRQRHRVTVLIPASARRTAGTVLACCALVTADRPVRYAPRRVRRSARRPDRRLDLAHLGNHGRALQLAADLGQPVQVAVLTTTLIVACLAARRVNGAVLAAVSLPVSGVLTERVLKPLVDESYSAYPSCRTTGAFALITIVAVLLAQQSRSMPWSGCRLHRRGQCAGRLRRLCRSRRPERSPLHRHRRRRCGRDGSWSRPRSWWNSPIVRTQMALVCPSLRRFAAQARPERECAADLSPPLGVTASVDPYRMTASVPAVSVGLWATFR